MEKKTKKSKIRNFQIFEKNQLYRKAIAYDKIGGYYALSANSNKNMLIRVFLHGEFVYAMKTVQNPTNFMKKAKTKNRKNE